MVNLPGRVDTSQGAILRTKICTFTLDERGFVRAHLDAGAFIELEDARDAILATWKTAGERRRPVLVDMTRIEGESRAARLHFVSDEAVATYSAVAMLVASPVSRVVGTFFLRLLEHKAPTRLFTDEVAAIDWLLDTVK
jgi:hypothetical protein